MFLNIELAGLTKLLMHLVEGLAYSPTRLLIVVKTVIIGFDTLPELNAEDRFFCYLETMLEP